MRGSQAASKEIYVAIHSEFQNDLSTLGAPLAVEPLSLWPTPPKRSWCGAPLGASLWCVAFLHYSAIQAFSELKTSQPDGGKGAMVRRLVHLDISNYEPPHTSACTGTRQEA